MVGHDAITFHALEELDSSASFASLLASTDCGTEAERILGNPFNRCSKTGVLWWKANSSGNSLLMWDFLLAYPASKHTSTRETPSAASTKVGMASTEK